MAPSSRDVLSSLRDEELLSAWQEGAALAGEILFERHYESVRRYFRNKVPPAAVPDLVQQTFLACTESRGRFGQRSTFRTYLLGIAHHLMIDHVRRAPRGHGQVDLDELVLADIHPPGDEAIAAKRERRLLLRALRGLRFPFQVVLELRYWEVLSDAEIAEVLDEPLGTIKTRLRAARHALEDRLAAGAQSADELRSTLDSLQRWAARVRQADVAGDARGERDVAG